MKKYILIKLYNELQNTKAEYKELNLVCHPTVHFTSMIPLCPISDSNSMLYNPQYEL
jgi:hypothetical protein